MPECERRQPEPCRLGRPKTAFLNSERLTPTHATALPVRPLGGPLRSLCHRLPKEVNFRPRPVREQATLGSADGSPPISHRTAV